VNSLNLNGEGKHTTTATKRKSKPGPKNPRKHYKMAANQTDNNKRALRRQTAKDVKGVEKVGERFEASEASVPSVQGHCPKLSSAAHARSRLVTQCAENGHKCVSSNVSVVTLQMLNAPKSVSSAVPSCNTFSSAKAGQNHVLNDVSAAPMPATSVSAQATMRESYTSRRSAVSGRNLAPSISDSRQEGRVRDATDASSVAKILANCAPKPASEASLNVLACQNAAVYEHGGSVHQNGAKRTGSVYQNGAKRTGRVRIQTRLR
jgi:hypothetical protein